MRNEHFQVTRPIGTGHSRENDVRRIRRALHATGYITAPPNPSGHYNAGAIAAIERFQRDHGLKIDGVVIPGGPTERVLDLALAARRESGEDGQKQLRDLFRNAAEDGLSFLPAGADDDSPGMFVDRDGEFASPERLRALLAPRGDDGGRGDEVQVANAAARTVIPVADAIAVVPLAVARFFGSPANPLVNGAALYARARAGDPEALAELKRSRDEATAGLPDLKARHAAKRDRAQAARTMTESGPTIMPGRPLVPQELPELPGYPAIERGKKDNVEELIPATGEEVSILPGPEIEPAKPEAFIFEALPDDEFWRRIHITERAGPPGTRLYNHKAIGRFFKRAGPSGTKEFEVIGGGYATDDPTAEPTNEKYRPELYRKRHESLEVAGKPTKNSSYADIAIRHKTTRNIALINTQTRNKNDTPTSAERWQSEKMLLNKETGDIYVEMGKPRPGQSQEERLDEYDDLIDEILKKLRTPKKSK